MKLYHHPLSPPSLACRMAARLMNLDLDLLEVDLFAGEQASPWYQAINPNRLVPTLIDDDIVLWESVAITQHMADALGDTSLLPAGRARADVTRWQSWALSSWAPAIQAYTFENLFKRLKGLGEPDHTLMDGHRARIARHATVLEATLSKKPFLAGDRITLADLSVASYLMHRDQAGLPIDDHPHVVAWLESVRALPAWDHAGVA